MSRKRASSTKSKGLSNLFGPPPIIEGEDAADYEKILSRLNSSVRSTDFIDEILIRDLADAVWNILRLRRLQAAYLRGKAWNVINDEASEIAEESAKTFLEGSEKEEMDKLLNSELGWETCVALYPRANEKFQELWSSAEAELDKDKIQADVIFENLDSIEQIEHLITVHKRRFDDINYEIDRRHTIQKARDRIQDVEEAEYTVIKPNSTVRRITRKKAA